MTMTPERARELVGHTPGPWEYALLETDYVHGETIEDGVEVSSGNRSIHTYDLGYDDGPVDLSIKDNARLIAAAPDLLTAYLAAMDENERLMEALMEVAEMCNWATATAVSEYIDQAMKPKEPKP